MARGTRNKERGGNKPTGISNYGFNQHGQNAIDRHSEANTRAPQGVYEALVMNDEDPQYMGRVWCYVVGVSDTTVLDEFPEGETPSGEPVHEIGNSSSENTWMRFLPVLPFMGSNDYRTEGDPRAGFSTSYGLWGQPRVGDRLLVVFSTSTFAEGYYIGGIPKPGQTAQLPGAPVDTVEGSDFKLPGTEVPLDSEAGDRKAPYSLSGNLERSGLQEDWVRGGSSSGARRESPSRVYGFKTPGNWQARAGDEPAIGHQLIMDDLPDNQLARLRSSRGNQVLLGDAVRSIYISTALGDSWIELNEDGHIDIYGGDSISIHAADDINLTAGRDLNIDVERDVNIRAKGGVLADVGGDWDLRVGGDMKERIEGSYDAYASSGDYKIYSGAQFHVLSAANLYVQSGSQSYYTGSSDININSNSQTNIQSGGSPATQAAEAAEINTAQQPGPPTADQIRASESGASVEYVAGQEGFFRVPQHEPWRPEGRSFGLQYLPAPPRGRQNTSAGGSSTATPAGTRTNFSDPGPIEPEDITKFVIHCSATQPSGLANATTINQWHQSRGWSSCGYHVVIQRDGTVESNSGAFGPSGKRQASAFMRTTQTRGAHVAGQNSYSIGVCLIGGLHDSETNAAGQSLHYPDYTDEQNLSLQAVIEQLKGEFPRWEEIIGHRDIPSSGKDCPCFDVSFWLSSQQFKAAVGQTGNPYDGTIVPTHAYNPPTAY